MEPCAARTAREALSNFAAARSVGARPPSARISITTVVWGWAVGSPNSDLVRMVDSENKFGSQLRADLANWVTRQLQLAFMIEVLPSQSNRVTVDPSYTDAPGNIRPVIYFNVPEYTMRGVAYARKASMRAIPAPVESTTPFTTLAIMVTYRTRHRAS